jgi:thioredoxin reductase (NADPH)
MSEVIIIGSGPAGISAALYTVRAGIKTTVISKSGGSLTKAEKIENYYGIENPISGNELISTGISQAKRLGVEIITDEVVSIGYDGKLTVKTKNSDYRAESVILATGSSRSTPKITGLADFEGKGVSYCAVCDGFFYRGKDVSVFGAGDFAISEAKELLPIAKSVTLLLNGQPTPENIPDGVIVNEQVVDSFIGQDGILSDVKFKDESSISVSGVFIAIGVASSTDFAKKLGAQTEGTKIVVNENMETNIPGLYAAGDCTGGLSQISTAVSEGAIAGTQVIRYLRSQKVTN